MNRLLVFDSVHQAIRAERMLRSKGIALDMAPTPREITASCGQSIAIGNEDEKLVRQMMEAEKVPYRGIYAMDAERGVYEMLIQEDASTWNSF